MVVSKFYISYSVLVVLEEGFYMAFSGFLRGFGSRGGAKRNLFSLNSLGGSFSNIFPYPFSVASSPPLLLQ